VAHQSYVSLSLEFSGRHQKSRADAGQWGNSTADEQLLQEKSRAISELQISRLSYVGSNSVTAKTIEQSFIKFLKVFD